MAGQDDRELIDEGLEQLAEDERPEDREQVAAFEQLAARVEEPGLQDRILERYLGHGKRLLSDSLPSSLDPRIAQRLTPLLGDVSNVRVHRGAMATAAARAMDARAFAIGDQDIFVDEREYDPNSPGGAALLAHEVAHTRDAATGFALSARSGGATSDRERFAQEVEREFAREAREEPAPEVERMTAPAPAAAGPAQPAGEPKVDKDELTELIWKTMRQQERRFRERHGA